MDALRALAGALSEIEAEGRAEGGHLPRVPDSIALARAQKWIDLDQQYYDLPFASVLSVARELQRTAPLPRGPLTEEAWKARARVLGRVGKTLEIAERYHSQNAARK